MNGWPMKVFSLILFYSLFLSFNSVANISSDNMTASCLKPLDTEENIYTSDFQWDYDLNGLREAYEVIYYSGKRLIHRAVYDRSTKKVFLSHVGLSGIVPVYLSWEFINSIRRHIENALKLDYVDKVFFPDMGHSHLLIDNSFYETQIKYLPVSDMSKAYELMLNHPKTRFLYHTAEQLQTLDKNGNLIPNKELMWRYFTRNLVGDNMSNRLWIYKDLSSKANTVNSPDQDNYHWWSAGFNISASKNACFPFINAKNGNKVEFFDISLSDLPSKSGTGDIFSKPRIQNKTISPDTPIWLWEKLITEELTAKTH